MIMATGMWEPMSDAEYLQRHGINLLAETRADLLENGKSPDDVRWVGTRDGLRRITWAAFEAIASVSYVTEYAQMVDERLVVVGDNWWLERRYDDDNEVEWWAFSQAPGGAPLPTPEGAYQEWTFLPDHGTIHRKLIVSAPLDRAIPAQPPYAPTGYTPAGEGDPLQ